jgi:integrase
MCDDHDKQKRDQYEKIGDRVSIFSRHGVWYANWLDSDGKQARRSLRTRSKKEARLRALKLDVQIEHGEAPRRQKTASIDAVIATYDDYLVAEGRAKKTLTKYRKVFERVKHIAASRDVLDMRGIDLSFADAYRKSRADVEAAPKTMHLEMTVLKQLVNFAFRRELVDKNRLSDLKLKRPKNTPQPWWTLPQLNLILAASAKSPYHSLYSLLGWTGLRIGEAKHLSWDDIDFEQRVVHVREKWIGPGKNDKWLPKGRDQRAVPLCDPALALLRSLPRMGRWVFTAPPTSQYPQRDRQIDERRALYHLKKVLKNVDLEGHLHTFRHTVISHALASGTPEASVRNWAGHVDAQILKFYTHVADEDSKAHMVRLFPMPGSSPGDVKQEGAQQAGTSTANKRELGPDSEPASK